MADPLEEAKIRLEWAKGQIRDLEAAIKRFRATNPYQFVVDTESKPGYKLYKVVPTADVPPEFMRMVGIAAQDLKGILDYTICQIGIQHGIAPDRLMFPIGNSKEALETQIKKLKIQRFSPDLADVIRTINPYHGGNDLLFGLHEMDRAYKHRYLGIIGMSASVNRMLIRHAVVREMSVNPAVAAGWNPLKDGLVLMELQGDFQGEIRFAVDVAPTKLKGFERQPILPVLTQMTGTVEGILLLLEDRFFR